MGLAGRTKETTLNLQRASGNRAVGLLLQRDRNRRDITFAADEGSVLTAHESSVDARLRTVHTQMTAALGDWFEAASSGLENFETTMAFASSQDAQSDVLAAMGKAFFVGGFKSLIGMIPVVGDAASLAFDVGMAAWDEEQRASGARGERNVAAFITATRDHLSDSRTATRNDHANRLDSFLDAYPGDRNRRVLTDAEGAWVHEAEAARRRFSSRIPAANQFRQELTERFAVTGDYVGYVNQGTFRRSGTLTLNVSASGGVAQGWRAESVDDHWMLHTSAPNADNVAQNLKDSLEGVSPVTSSLHKVILISAETETGEVEGKLKISGVLGQSPVWVDFDSTSDLQEFRHRRQVMNSIGHSPAIATAALAVTDIHGSDD